MAQKSDAEILAEMCKLPERGNPYKAGSRRKYMLNELYVPDEGLVAAIKNMVTICTKKGKELPNITTQSDLILALNGGISLAWRRIIH